VNAESIIMQEGLVRYGLLDSDLIQPDMTNPSVAYILQLFVEKNNKVRRGQVTSTGAAGLTFTDANFPYDSDTEIDSDYLVAFYAGPGAGQLRQLNTVDSNLLFTVDTDYVSTDTLTTNSKYAVWDPTTDAQDEWYRLTAVRFNAMEYPDYMELRNLYPSAYGMRIRVVYVENTTDLLAEAELTRVPEEYVAFRSLSYLYDELVGDNRHDRASHAGLAEYYASLAEDFVRSNRRTLPAATLWQEQDLAGFGFGNVADPLGWGD
jgi:hypothetical protein